jgi:hypothetical protein
MAASGCVWPGCGRPADGYVELNDIAGAITYPGQCRDHLLIERTYLDNQYRASRASIAWASCKQCGGEGQDEGKVCLDCTTTTETGGPLRFGDILHNGTEVAMYVAVETPRWARVVPLSWNVPSPVWNATVDTFIWDRCGISPCNHPFSAQGEPA